jgi:hypothetical protein
VALRETAIRGKPQNNAVTNPPIQGRRTREICHLCPGAVDEK